MRKWMRRPLVVVLVVLSREVGAQTPAALSFEIASIKPNNSGAANIHFGLPPGGRFTVTNAPLREIVRVAYGIPDFLIVDAPAWLQTARFDIEARAEGNPDLNGHLLLLRQLLADRFKLVIHNETRQMPVYALVRAKDDGALGPRLKPAAADCVAILAAARNGVPPPKSNRILCGSRSGPGTLSIGGQTMVQVAALLWPLVGRVVIDQTSIEGSFDFDLEFTSDNQSPNAPPLGASDKPSVFTAMQEQLGLKLEPRHGPVQVLVIDHVERPTEN